MKTGKALLFLLNIFCSITLLGMDQPITKPVGLITPTMVYSGKKPGGAAPGAVYQEIKTGKKYLVKYLPDAAAMNEFLASQLYKLAGILVPDMQLIDISQFAIPEAEQQKIAKLGTIPTKLLAVEFIEGLEKINPKKLVSNSDFLDGFLIDAWLGNYDVIGLENDNVMMKGKDALRIDIGAALLYRASGAPKGESFNNKINEFNFLRGTIPDRELNDLLPIPPDADPVKRQAYPMIRQTLKNNSAQIFKGLKRSNIENGLKKLTSIPDQTIYQLAVTYSADKSEGEKLALLLLDRKHALLSKKDEMLAQFK